MVYWLMRSSLGLLPKHFDHESVKEGTSHHLRSSMLLDVTENRKRSVIIRGLGAFTLIVDGAGVALQKRVRSW